MFNEKENMSVQTENIGKRIMELSIGKKSFGSFFIPHENKEVMTYLPYFQQGIWKISMNKDKTIFWKYHKNLSYYDFELIFSFEESLN